jgi:hypothetical protein
MSENALMPQPISDLEMQVAYEGPAANSNRYVLTIHGQIARIAFLEQSPTGVVAFRSAVCMPVADLPGLVRLIQSVTSKMGVGLR